MENLSITETNQILAQRVEQVNLIFKLVGGIVSKMEEKEVLSKDEVLYTLSSIRNIFSAVSPQVVLQNNLFQNGTVEIK